MAKQKLLAQLQQFLVEEQMECTLEQANDELPFDRLLVDLGSDEQGRGRILEITAQEQLLTDEIPQKIAKGIKGFGYHRLQFKAYFPFTYEDNALQDLSSAILFINKMMELPGLELSEFDNRVSYRFVTLTSLDNMSKPLFFSILGNAMLILDGFSSSIDSIARGQLTFNQLLQQVVEAGKQLPS